MGTTPTINYVTAGQRNTASDRNNIKDYLDFLLNPPGCSVYRTVAGTAVNATWSAGLGMDGEDYDRDGMHDTTTNNSRVVFNTAGRYRVTARLRFASNATGARGMMTRLNAAGDAATGTLMTYTYVSAVNGQDTVLEQNWSRVFSVGDYIEMFAYQTSGGNLAYNPAIRHLGIETLMIGTN